MNITADGNRAYGYDFKDYDRIMTPTNKTFDVVAGIDINMGKNKNSDTKIIAIATNNIAKNYQSTPGDAVAGVDITVGSLINTKQEFEVDLTADNNYAYSANGDAVSGTRVTIGRTKNASIKDDQNTASNNAADAPNGDATTDASDIVVRNPVP